MQRLDLKTKRLLKKLVNNNLFTPHIKESLTNFDRLYRSKKKLLRKDSVVLEDNLTGKKTPKEGKEGKEGMEGKEGEMSLMSRKDVRRGKREMG